ncbi:MAG TPA: hypothetical protein VIF15_10500 [Polyangiaceae bacterium]|jgi:hypothetical protein
MSIARLPLVLGAVLVAWPALGAAPKGKPKPEVAPVGIAPDVKLTVDAPTTRGTWTMRVTNGGEVPVRLVADARLLTLEVTPRGAKKAARCRLADDMRPTDDLEQPLVLPPGRTYVESFEPRLLCFGGRELDALEPQATVVAHLGWPGRAQGKPPFEVAPIDGVEPLVAPRKELEAPPIALPDEPTPAQAAPVPRRPDDPDPAKLALVGSRTVDASSPGQATLTVTLRNTGSRPVSVRFRPETLAFDIAGGGAAEHCGWPQPVGAAMRELFTTLRPGGSDSLTVMLRDYCGGHALDRPGLLVVRPILDTRKASGVDVGLRTFDGEVIATTPTLVRLHQGARKTPLGRPRLEPAPAAP